METRAKAAVALHDLHLLPSDDLEVWGEVVPRVLVDMVDENLVDGVNRPLSFLVGCELDVLLVQTLLNQGADVDQRPDPRLRVAQFLHTLIVELLMIDELDHYFADSVPLLDVGSFASYDALDQDLPDDSWNYLYLLRSYKQGLGRTSRKKIFSYYE